MANVQLQISELARRAGVSIRTVRYYEEVGLLQPSGHTSGGIRLYGERDVNRLISIRRLKKMSLNVEEIKACLGMIPSEKGRRPRIEHTLDILRMQKDKIGEQITELTEISREIDESLELVANCLTCNVSPCPDSCPSYRHIL